jgi:hypothetical protein
MDLLRSSSAPFVIAALLSVLGWHIGTLTKDIRDTRSVVYQVRDTGKAGATINTIITNVSKSEMLENASFALVCENLEPCLDYDSRDVVLFPPTATDSGILSGDSPILGIKVDLAAGGRIGVSVKRATAHKVFFLFFPKGLPIAEESEAAAPAGGPPAAGAGRGQSGTEDIYVLDGGTPRGWVVLNYFNIVLASFFGVLILFVFGTITIGLRRPESRPPEKKGEGAVSVEPTPGSGDAA